LVLVHAIAHDYAAPMIRHVPLNRQSAARPSEDDA
jgi:hypothetical protein